MPSSREPEEPFLLSYDGFDLDAEGLREVLASTGNGRFCSRGAAEWENADGVHYPGTYAHGLHNTEPTIVGGVPVLNEDLVNLPNWLVLKLKIEGGSRSARHHAPARRPLAPDEAAAVRR